MQDHKDELRLRSLYKERLLEIKRQGVIVELYHRQQILPAYLQCALADRHKLQALLDSKLSLELCDLNGLPIMKIGKKSYFSRRKDLYDECRVYLQSKQPYRGMREGPLYILVKNNATIGVLSQILSKRLEGDRYFHKIQEFIGDSDVKEITLQKKLRLKYETQSDLNEEQNEAVRKVFMNHLTFVKGPPGCGKTKTVSRMVKMLAERGMKVLVGSVSNIANQTLINQIIRQMTEHNYLCDHYPQINMKRLHLIINYSHKAIQKISEQAKQYSLNNQLYHYILKENKSTEFNSTNIMAEIQKLQEGVKVSNIFWAIYMKSYDKLIADANVIISTTVNSSKLSRYTEFKPDVGIIDEAAQASWTDTYGFLVFGVTRMVFLGDDKQLRPTVIGDSSNQILKETMFEKLSQKNPAYFVHLRRQYRMHPQISQFSNKYIYNSLLINDPSTSDRQCSLQYFRQRPVSFVAHNFTQQVNESSQSINSQKGVKQFYNESEGSLIMDFLFSVPIEEWKNIGVLTFYDMQRQVLTQSLESSVKNFDKCGLTIKTIDGYQGGEKDYILISTVRSNEDKNPGFCAELNRVNVSLTRAKKGMIVFGDPETLSQGKSHQDPDQNIWAKFLNFMLSKKQVLTTEHWQEQIKAISHKETTRNRLYAIYMDSLHIMQVWNGFIAESQDQILQKNPSFKLSMAFILETLIQQTGSETLQLKLAKFLTGFGEQKTGQNQIQERRKKDLDEDFKHKVHQILSVSFTQKQILYALNLIYMISKDIYEIISRHHDLKQFDQLYSEIKRKLHEEKGKIIAQIETAVGEWLQIKKQGSSKLMIEREVEIQKLLVSSKLTYGFLSIYQRQIDPEMRQAEKGNAPKR